MSEAEGWSAFRGGRGPAAAEVALPATEAWRVFFNAASADEARSLAVWSGDPELVDAVLRMRSVMV